MFLMFQTPCISKMKRIGPLVHILEQSASDFYQISHSPNVFPGPSQPPEVNRQNECPFQVYYLEFHDYTYARTIQPTYVDGLEER